MTQAIRIIPAILTDNPQALQTMLHQSATFTDYVQIDIMDGKFVPSRSVTWKQITGVPPQLQWEAHLMLKEPELELENFQKAGAIKAIFHYEATTSPRKSDLSGASARIVYWSGCEPGNTGLCVRAFCRFSR